jgi:hypothetical protein
MTFQTIISKLIDSVKVEVQRDEHTNVILNDIIYPIVHKIIEQLYPYFIGFSVVLTMLILAIFVILFLNVKICYFNPKGWVA